MDQKIALKRAFAEAEKDQQEKEIGRIKQIVQSHLEKIQSKRESRRKLDEEIRLLEKDLDDLKSGRLDHIAERHEKDERARDVRIIVVEKVEKEYIPYYPWRSPWVVRWITTPQFTSGTNPNIQYCATTTASGQMTTANTIGATLTLTGTQFSNFVGGSYVIGDHTINL